MTFDSYHWHGSLTGTPELERARKQLATKRDRAAFELLLRSDDAVGIGIALDQFHYADASTRHGTSNPFEEYRDEVVAHARKVLRAAPSAATLGTEEGVNHASALGALMNLAEQEDAALIVGALEQARTSDVRLAAVYAGSTVLENSRSPDENLITAIEQVAFDGTAELDERRAAVSALGRTQSASATDALLRATRLADLGLQARAALHLLHRDRRTHRARIEDLTRGWPEDPPYPAKEVFDLLSASDEDLGDIG
jgi:hypothetical protein